MLELFYLKLIFLDFEQHMSNTRFKQHISQDNIHSFTSNTDTLAVASYDHMATPTAINDSNHDDAHDYIYNNVHDYIYNHAHDYSQWICL